MCRKKKLIYINSKFQKFQSCSENSFFSLSNSNFSEHDLSDLEAVLKVSKARVFMFIPTLRCCLAKVIPNSDLGLLDSIEKILIHTIWLCLRSALLTCFIVNDNE